MPASIRVIRIMKDKNPVDGSEVDDYTVEFECIADDSAKLAQELAKCPLGERVLELLDRAEFLPENVKLSAEDIKREAEEEDKARLEREEELREEGRSQIREKYIDYILRKRKGKPDHELLTREEVENETEEHSNDEEEEKESVPEPTPEDFQRDGRHLALPP